MLYFLKWGLKLKSLLFFVLFWSYHFSFFWKKKLLWCLNTLSDLSTLTVFHEKRALVCPVKFLNDIPSKTTYTEQKLDHYWCSKNTFNEMFLVFFSENSDYEVKPRGTCYKNSPSILEDDSKFLSQHINKTACSFLNFFITSLKHFITQFQRSGGRATVGGLSSFKDIWFSTFLIFYHCVDTT